ncbi:hypothetical protein L6452_41401 [Arctium lappa]|uniref:Uncharacterized protein n=1 Tax=Arctium lappa TaxID=4217 RepID=A0ACB8XQ21_ARCLA|nr:hypothetical protein L6452_41401 [Arctium lappa]
MTPSTTGNRRSTAAVIPHSASTTVAPFTPPLQLNLEALKGGRQIWLLSNFDSQEDIAYPNDPRVPIKVDDELKGLFRAIELPRDMLDIERELQKNGMKPATNTAKRRVAAQNFGSTLNKPKQKKKKTEISKRTKLTNLN